MWFRALVALVICAQTAVYALGPLVSIFDGNIRGTLLKDFGGTDYEAYFGIPFAKPPVGSLRFANPQPNDGWTGEYDATVERSECLQKELQVPGAPVHGSEDCLYMNVYKPHGVKKRLPVLFCIHGGAFFGGSASKGLWGPERIMSERQVILVVAQYRLGVFGFLSTGDAAAPGNFGLKDQALALRWVQNNIRDFGGDPSKVTIIGQSAGAASVQMHMMSPMSRGLFQKAIALGGSALSHWSLPAPHPLKLAQEHAKAVGITNAESLTTSQLVNSLRAVNGTLLTSSIDLLKMKYLFPITLYRPVLETLPGYGSFLCEDPETLWKNGNYANVPLMMGNVPNDGATVSVPILANPALFQLMNSNTNFFLPALADAVPSAQSFLAIKQRFFPSTSATVIPPMSQPFMQMISESWFFYPTAKTLKQRVQDRRHLATIAYSFEFRGRYSYSSVVTKNNDDYGVCHQDELLYLFYSPALFPNFPAGSPEAAMAKKWTKFILDFVTARMTSQMDMCSPYCRIITFSNSNSNDSPVEITYSKRIDEDMFTFWDNFYKSNVMINV